MTIGTAVDPYAPDFQQDPFPVYARLRELEPVHQVEGHGWYIVSTMELVAHALRHPDIFANSVTSARRSEPPAEVADEIAAIRAEGHPYVPALNLNDPPIHTRYRRLINRAFTPRSIAHMEPQVESVAAELASALGAAAPGPVDIIAAVTQPLPVFAILRILGLDDDRRADIVRWSNAASASLGRRLSPQEWVQAERDNLDFQLNMARELEDRRHEPRDDLLSNLVKTEKGEEPIPIGELVWLARELLVAGNETTTRSLAEAVFGLNDRPDEWDRLRTDPEQAAADIAEESIRLSTPAFGMFRRVTTDTVLGGVELPPESVVFLAYGAANRDPALFDDPETFLPGRARARDHVAFGYGIHVCVGAPLARMESSAVLRAMARVVDRLEVVEPDRVAYLPSFFLRGIVELPVIIHPLTEPAPAP